MYCRVPYINETWQFDSQPLKVVIHPNLLVCRWRATYYWKALNAGYNFALDFISIGGLHTKLWAPKVVGVPSMRISRLTLGSPGTKCHLGASSMAKHKVYYKGECGGFPQVWAMVSVVNLNLPMVCPTTKSAPLCINQLVWFMQVRVSDYVLFIFLNPILEL